MSSSGWRTRRKCHRRCYLLLPDQAQHNARIMADRIIYRETAIAAYKRGAEKDSLPRLISWPIVVSLWLLLGLCIAAGFLGWHVKLPAYIEGRGVIAGEQGSPASMGEQPAAIVFLPTA